jgi:hypothetical protein
MRKFILVAALGLALSGCVTSGTGVNVGTVTSIIAQVQAATTAACGYLPAASSVANILATFVSGGALVVGGAEAAANAICSALSAKAGRFGGSRVVRVRGVILHGRFVR